MKKHANEIVGIVALALFYLLVLTQTQSQLSRLLSSQPAPSSDRAGISSVD